MDTLDRLACDLGWSVTRTHAVLLREANRLGLPAFTGAHPPWGRMLEVQIDGRTVRIGDLVVTPQVARHARRLDTNTRPVLDS